MIDNTTTSQPELDDVTQKRLAINLFNFTWTLMKKKDRSVEETDTMIHAAHSSRYHWAKVPAHGPKEMSIGEWQISRVYALLGRSESSLWHAKRCLEICEAHVVEVWLEAFAHEAMARAYASGGDKSHFEVQYQRALELADGITDKEDRDLLLSDLIMGPWYGFVENESTADIRDDG
jgi:hypothetical protein